MPDELTPELHAAAAPERTSGGVEANRKGNLLERAVALIETTILKSVPDARAMNFSVQPNKRFNIDGVRHEIDLYVELAPAKGYESSFIFESKNQEEAVSKNAIIGFSEKIRVTKAQQGYFIAPRFTSDALAQARQDSASRSWKPASRSLRRSVRSGT